MVHSGHLVLMFFYAVAFQWTIVGAALLFSKFYQKLRETQFLRETPCLKSDVKLIQASIK